MSRALQIDALRQVLASHDRVAGPAGHGGFTNGASSLDGALRKGLARGAVHEVLAPETGDAAAASGFVMGMAVRAGANEKGVVWIRSQGAGEETGQVCAHGLAQMGARPESVVLVTVDDGQAGLRAAFEAVRCKGLGVVVLDVWGHSRHLDHTATRRLSLAASETGVTSLLCLVKAPVKASAALTRWQVRAAVSRSPGLGLPGRAAFEVALLKQRAGAAGQRWRLEWDHEAKAFCEQALPGAVAPLSFDGPHRAARHPGWAQTG